MALCYDSCIEERKILLGNVNRILTVITNYHSLIHPRTGLKIPYMVI